MNRLLALKRSVTAKKWILLFCIFGFIVNLLMYHPGFMAPDTTIQYEQAVTGKYDDWHPPVMAFVWHLLNYFYRGPLPMLTIQLLLLWSSCFLIATSLPNKGWRISACFLFLLAPFIHNYAGTVLKDSQMGLSWLLASALLLKATTNTDNKSLRAYCILSACLLLYGTWVRYNAVTGLPPMCVAWSWISFRRQKSGRKAMYAAGLLLFVSISQKPFTRYALGAREQHTDWPLYFHDLTGIFIKTHENVYPASLYKFKGFDTVYIRNHYDPLDLTTLIWPADNKQLLDIDYQDITALRKAWIKAIKQHPALYLRNRWDIYMHFLNLKPGPPEQYYYAWIAPNNFNCVLKEDNWFYRLYINYITLDLFQIFFKVWFWIFLNVLLLPLAPLLKNRSLRLLYVCVILSGFLYSLPQFIVSNFTKDFRFIYWTCIACMLAMLILFFDRLSNKKKRLSSMDVSRL